MSLLNQVKIEVTGPHAEEAHDLFHKWDTEHHGFANFNGLNFADAGDFGIVARGSNKVIIGLHGKAAKNPQEVVNRLKASNPNWTVKVK